MAVWGENVDFAIGLPEKMLCRAYLKVAIIKEALCNTYGEFRALKAEVKNKMEGT